MVTGWIRRAALVLAACAAFGASTAPPLAWAQARIAPATAVIQKVVFTGTASDPVITITGSGFGTKPKPDPKLSPAKAGTKYHSACDTQALQGNHRDGFDYGPTALGIGWGTSTPSGYGAGVYVPGSYLDCIGLVVKSYSSTKVVLHLGCQYALYAQISTGDRYLIQVAGVNTTGIVTYGL